MNEYDEIQKELVKLKGHPADLAPGLRQLIEGSVRPAYLRRRRAERVVLVVLVALFLLSFSPLPPNDLVRDFFEVMNDPTSWSDSSIVFAIVAGVAIPAATIVAVGLTGSRASARVTAVLAKRVAIAITVFAGLCCVAALVVGLLARENAQQVYSEEGVVALSDAQLNSADGDANRAPYLIAISTPLLGLLLGGAYLSARTFRRGPATPI